MSRSSRLVVEIAQGVFVLAVQELLDQHLQFVFLDQHRFGVHPGLELDLVERLQVGGVGDGDEQPHAAPHQRQRTVLADQRFLDQVFGDRLDVERGQVEQGHAELFRGADRDVAWLRRGRAAPGRRRRGCLPGGLRGWTWTRIRRRGCSPRPGVAPGRSAVPVRKPCGGAIPVCWYASRPCQTLSSGQRRSLIAGHRSVDNAVTVRNTTP
jgi:hypothetical protein